MSNANTNATEIKTETETEIQNLLTEELILFLKQILNNFEEFRTYVTYAARQEYCLFHTALIEIGYDGFLSSVVNNDEFWNPILPDALEYWWVYEQLKKYKFTLIEKSYAGILPYIILPEDFEEHNFIVTLWDYIRANWTTQIKEPLQFWAQMEFCGISPK